MQRKKSVKITGEIYKCKYKASNSQNQFSCTKSLGGLDELS